MSNQVRLTIAFVALGIEVLLVLLLNVTGGLTARRRGRSFSFIPIVFGLVGALGGIMAPWPWPALLVPIALVADFTIPLLLYTLVRYPAMWK